MGGCRGGAASGHSGPVEIPPAGVNSTAGATEATYVEHPVPLDPVTVDFLQQSELLLRNVVKMGPKARKTWRM